MPGTNKMGKTESSALHFGSFGCVRLPKDFGLGWVLVYYYIKHSLYGCAVENRAQMEADLTDICSNFED